MFSLILKCDTMTLNLRRLECFHSRDQYLCKIRLLKQQQPKKHLRAERVQLSQHLFGTPIWPPHVMWNLSPPQRFPLGIPIKIAIIRKNRKRARERWKEGKGTLCFSFSAAFPQHKDASAEERDVKPWHKALYMFICFYSSSHEISSSSIISSFWLGAALIEWYHDYHNFVRMGSVFSPNGGRHIQ